MSESAAAPALTAVEEIAQRSNADFILVLRGLGAWIDFIITFLFLLAPNVLLAGGIPAGILVSMSRRHRRLGDMLAQAYIVRVRDLAAVQAERR
jgi:hypothetical protein